MSDYTPDTWVMVKITHKGSPVYKILAGCGGSYLYGASWKLNSGVTEVTQDATHYSFKGSSGSVYHCHKNAYGFSGYTAQIYNNFVTDLEGNDETSIEVLDADADFMNLNYE